MTNKCATLSSRASFYSTDTMQPACARKKALGATKRSEVDQQHQTSTPTIKHHHDEQRQPHTIYPPDHPKTHLTNKLTQKMMLRIVFQYIAVSAILLAASAAKKGDDSEQCGMYMAISSTSTVDDTKWGLYAGQDIPKDSPIGYPDIAINIFNLQGNAHLADESEDSLSLVANTVEFFEQFIWVPLPSGGHFELEEGRAVTAIPGAGVLGGFNPKLTNADWNHSSAYFRPALGEQPTVNHPGRGAYTNFFNVGLRSKEEIQAGREIFLGKVYCIVSHALLRVYNIACSCVNVVRTIVTLSTAQQSVEWSGRPHNNQSLTGVYYVH